MNKLVLAAVAAALLAAPAARAQDAAPPLPQKWGSVEVGGGPYLPSIDAEFDDRTPFADVFGSKRAPMFRLHVGKTIFQSFGVLELGVKTGFWGKTGHAINPDNQQRTGDRTGLNVIPTSLTLTYRLDEIWERAHVPLIPYGRVALERYNWWVTKEGKWTKKGATNGWSATAGVGLVLDWMDPDASRELGNETGVAHTMIYFDLTRTKVDDFGSSKSWDLSDDRELTWSAGLMVAF